MTKDLEDRIATLETELSQIRPLLQVLIQNAELSSRSIEQLSNSITRLSSEAHVSAKAVGVLGATLVIANGLPVSRELMAEGMEHLTEDIPTDLRETGANAIAVVGSYWKPPKR